MEEIGFVQVSKQFALDENHSDPVVVFLSDGSDPGLNAGELYQVIRTTGVATPLIGTSTVDWTTTEW